MNELVNFKTGHQILFYYGKISLNYNNIFNNKTILLKKLVNNMKRMNNSTKILKIMIIFAPIIINLMQDFTHI